MKYKMGDKVRFVGYNEDELGATPDYKTVFEKGDILRIISQGKGVTEDEDIVVKRLSDGKIDMVFPEEITRVRYRHRV